jgi:uncharacterized protein YbaR (Trm112 family)
MNDQPANGAPRPEEPAPAATPAVPSGPRAVDPKLLEILVCPLTKGPLRYDMERQELVSERAGLAYPIRDGIPIMLVDEARHLDEGTTA